MRDLYRNWPLASRPSTIVVCGAGRLWRCEYRSCPNTGRVVSIHSPMPAQSVPRGASSEAPDITRRLPARPSRPNPEDIPNDC